MTELFVNHADGRNPIPLDPSSLLPLLLLLTLRQTGSQPATSLLTRDSGKTLRGMAILLLLFGHLAKKCISGSSPLDDVGKSAVIIFLLLSGIALGKTYGLSDLGRDFFRKRLRRLLIPTWLTLALFYGLDFLLLHKTYPLSQLTLNTLGILPPQPPNGPYGSSPIFLSYTSCFSVPCACQPRP